MDEPDFEALRAARNAQIEQRMEKFADEMGVPLQELRTTFDHNSCYCACSSGGPCEHRWDGPKWVSEDKRGMSATCSRCGTTAMSHSMWNF